MWYTRLAVPAAEPVLHTYVRIDLRREARAVARQAGECLEAGEAADDADRTALHDHEAGIRRGQCAGAETDHVEREVHAHEVMVAGVRSSAALGLRALASAVSLLSTEGAVARQGSLRTRRMAATGVLPASSALAVEAAGCLGAPEGVPGLRPRPGGVRGGRRGFLIVRRPLLLRRRAPSSIRWRPHRRRSHPSRWLPARRPQRHSSRVASSLADCSERLRGPVQGPFSRVRAELTDVGCVCCRCWRSPPHPRSRLGEGGTRAGHPAADQGRGPVAVRGGGCCRRAGRRRGAPVVRSNASDSWWKSRPSRAN